MTKSREIDRALEDEIRLLGLFIDVVQQFQPQTEEGGNLKNGWNLDLTEWRDTNRALIRMSSEDLENSLTQERAQLAELEAVARNFTPNRSSTWWNNYFDRERVSAGRLLELVQGC